MKYSISNEYEYIILSYIKECEHLIREDINNIFSILMLQNKGKDPKIIPENLIKYKRLLQERKPKELVKTIIGWRLIAESYPKIQSGGSGDLDLPSFMGKEDKSKDTI